jgi:hypothetical protein
VSVTTLYPTPSYSISDIFLEVLPDELGVGGRQPRMTRSCGRSVELCRQQRGALSVLAKSVGYHALKKSLLHSEQVELNGAMYYADTIAALSARCRLASLVMHLLQPISSPSAEAQT